LSFDSIHYSISGTVRKQNFQLNGIYLYVLMNSLNVDASSLYALIV